MIKNCPDEDIRCVDCSCYNCTIGCELCNNENCEPKFINYGAL